MIEALSSDSFGIRNHLLDGISTNFDFHLISLFDSSISSRYLHHLFKTFRFVIFRAIVAFKGATDAAI